MRRPSALTTEILLLLGGLTAAAIAATYPLIRHLSTRLPNDLTDPVLVAWVMAWDAESLRRGLTSLFNAPSFFPYLDTLVYSETMIGVAIFTAPLQWLTANPIFVYNVAFILSFVNAGAGMYLLARTLTGRRDAAFLAALGYALTPQRVAQFAHLQWLMTGWLPLSLWALHRYFDTTKLRYMLTAALAYALQGLTSSYFTYFSLLPLAAVGIFEFWRVRPAVARLAVHVAAAAVVSAVLLAPLVAAYGRARREHDFKRPASEIVSLSADLSDYLHAHQHVRLWSRGPWGNGEHELFPGAILLALAVTAACVAARSTPASGVMLYGGIAVAALVLSLGPQPSAWGHRAPFGGPYQLLLTAIPGLDGLRALSRLSAIVTLGLAAMAASGAAWWLDRVRPQRRWLVTAALGVGMAVEGSAAPIHTVPFDPLGAPGDRQAYTWLRDRGPDGAVLELPMSHTDEEREQRYQYLTLWHGHRLVNGRSGYTPALTQWLYGAEQSPLNDLRRLDVAVAFLRTIGVRYVVVHLGALTSPAEAAMLRELAGDFAQVTDDRRFGGTAVFTLAAAAPPVPAADRRVIPANQIHARASHSADRLPLLFDGDRDSRWLTGTRQTGDEWIELAFDTPHAVAAVRMQTAERSFGDYPRDLAIDLVEDAGTRTVFRGSVLPAFGRGLDADLTYPWIDIRLPDNQARLIRLRQLGTTDQLFWSIHELQIEERTR